MRLSAGFCLASALPGVARGGDEDAELENLLKIERTTIKVGAKKTFKALHISDTHLSFADERDVEEKRNFAKARRDAYFGDTRPILDASIRHAQKNDEMLIHTGDLTDFVSEQNLDVVEERFGAEFARIVATGNHEFSMVVGKDSGNEEYKRQSFERVQRSYPNDLTFCSKVVNGVNFVAFDDVYFYVADDQQARFEAEVAKGLPIVALCHVPFFTPELFEPAIKTWSSSSELFGVPEELVRTRYAESCVSREVPTETTRKFYERLKNEPLLKAILCGHLHFSWVGKFSETATQYVVGGNSAGTAREITFE